MRAATVVQQFVLSFIAYFILRVIASLLREVFVEQPVHRRSINSKDCSRMFPPTAWTLVVPSTRRPTHARFQWQLHVLGTLRHLPPGLRIVIVTRFVPAEA